MSASASVLLVEDSSELRNLIGLVLERAEDLHLVGSAEDGRQALQMAERLKPELVVLDLALPELDGLQAIPELRRLVPGCKILVYSGFEGEQVQAVARNQGADAYLGKSAPVQQLLTVLRQLANVKGPWALSPAQAGSLVDLLGDDLRNPLSILKGYLDLLGEGALGEMNDRGMRLLPAMTQRTLQMTQLVERLILLARLEAGALALNPSPLDLQSVATDVFCRVSPQLLNPEQVQLGAGGQVKVLADREQLKMAIGCLVSFVLGCEAGPALCSIQRENGEAALALGVSGLVLDGQQEEALFEPFSNVNGKLGHSLDMYFARTLLRLQSGDVKIGRTESGTLFRMVLPALPEDPLQGLRP